MLQPLFAPQLRVEGNRWVVNAWYVQLSQLVKRAFETGLKATVERLFGVIDRPERRRGCAFAIAGVDNAQANLVGNGREGVVQRGVGR